MRRLPFKDSELDAHADDPERISPRSMRRFHGLEDESVGLLESTKFGKEYREKVKARIMGHKPEPVKAVLSTDRFWKTGKVG